MWECLRITSRGSTVLNMAATLRKGKRNMATDGNWRRFDTIFHVLLQGGVWGVEGQYIYNIKLLRYCYPMSYSQCFGEFYQMHSYGVM